MLRFSITSIIISIFLFYFLKNCLFEIGENDNLHPDFGLNIVEFLGKYNYPFEVHQVKTEDEYLLTVHRITNKRFNYNLSEELKPAILMVHGILIDSMNFVNMGPGTALSLRLADEGYDVWLLNMRGTTWSRNHTYLDPNNKSDNFWNFSFHEVGYYDLPASIDYILKLTKLDNLTYVGFSEGTTVFMVMTSLKPEYNDKINLAVALAPVAYMQNVTSPLIYMIKTFDTFLDGLLNILNVQEILPYYSPLMRTFAKHFCNKKSIFLDMCASVVNIFGGFDDELFNKTFLPVIGSNDPAGTSKKTIKHYIQFVYTEFFRQYDYGEEMNKQIYNSSVPPSYDLSKISAPIFIMHAKNDYFASITDVERLINELTNVVGIKLVEWDKFTHTDFLWAINLNKFVNNQVINVINKFNNKL